MFSDSGPLLSANERFIRSGELLSRSNFIEVSQLGKSRFSSVFHVRSASTQREYAMKLISMSVMARMNIFPQLEREISTLLRCDSERVVRLLGGWEEGDSFVLLFELAETDLYERLAQQGVFTEREAANVLRDVASALAYIHSQKPPILHRDLKPENVLLVGGQWKLADFGWSNSLDQAGNTFCGTFDYQAPEMINGGEQSEKLDIWGLGVMIFELLQGRPPFSPEREPGNTRFQAKLTERNILAGKIDFEGKFSPEAEHAIRIMTAPNPRHRPSALECLALPFFQKYTNITCIPNGQLSSKQPFAADKNEESEKRLNEASLRIAALEAEQRKLLEEKRHFLENETKQLNEIETLNRYLLARNQQCASLTNTLNGISTIISDHQRRNSPYNPNIPPLILTPSEIEQSLRQILSQSDDQGQSTDSSAKSSFECELPRSQSLANFSTLSSFSAPSYIKLSSEKHSSFVRADPINPAIFHNMVKNINQFSK